MKSFSASPPRTWRKKKDWHFRVGQVQNVSGDCCAEPFPRLVYDDRAAAVQGRSNAGLQLRQRAGRIPERRAVGPGDGRALLPFRRAQENQQRQGKLQDLGMSVHCAGLAAGPAYPILAMGSVCIR